MRSRGSNRFGAGIGALTAAAWLRYLALGAYCAFSLAAFLWVFLSSMKTNVEFVTSDPFSLPSRINFSNFVTAWNRANVGRFFANSVVVSGASTIGSLVLAFPTAYVVARMKSGRVRWVEHAYLTGIMVPTILTVVPLYLMFDRLHLVGTRLGLILIYVALMMPFSVYYLAGYLKSLPSELEEAAIVDGCSLSQVITRIVLPLSGPALAAVLVVNFLWAWNDFYYALIFLQNKETFTIPIGLYNLQFYAEYSLRYADLLAGMIINIIPVFVLYLFLQDYIVKGLTAGALKG